MPYPMMYSSGNEGINDRLLPPHAECITPPSTRHLNYHDVAGLMPFLRYLGMLGAANAGAFLAYRNQAVLAGLRDHGRDIGGRTVGA